jgi:hypothetical protein
MSIGRTRRGPKPLTARDWLFGSRPRRLALRFVLHAEPPNAGWTKSEIAFESGVSKHGGVDEHVDGLVALGLLKERDGRYVPGNPAGVLHLRLLALIDELERVPEQRIDELLSERSHPNADVRPAENPTDD